MRITETRGNGVKSFKSLGTAHASKKQHMAPVICAMLAFAVALAISILPLCSGLHAQGTVIATGGGSNSYSSGFGSDMGGCGSVVATGGGSNTDGSDGSSDGSDSDFAGVVDLEKARELFELYSEIELLQSKKGKQLRDILEIEEKIRVAEIQMLQSQNRSKALLEEYAEMLKERQKSGEGALVALMLSSTDLSNFFFRLGILERLSGAYSRVVDSLDAEIKLEEEIRDSLTEEKDALVAANEELEVQIADLEVAAAELEAYLDRQGGDREAFEKQLEEFAEKWGSLKPMFAKNIENINNFLASGGFSTPLFEVKFTLGGLRGVVEEAVFNQMINEALESAPGSTPMVFTVKDGGVYIEMPEHEIELFGHFEADEQILVYKVESGEFLGMRMSDAALDDLFFERELTFDLSPALAEAGNIKIKDIKVYDGYIDIGVSF